jgi:hypothetical protein
MIEYTIVIEGIVPLLQHRYVFKDELEQASKKKSGSIDYTEEWKKGLYYTEETGLYQPAVHIEGAMIKAASNFQITGRGKRTYKDLFKSAVFVAPDAISYGYDGMDADGLRAAGKISVHRAVVVVAKSRVERLRPMLPVGWRLSFTVQVHDEQIQKSVLKDILDHAGKFVGIGDYRPRYGRFLVTHFE